MAIVNRDLDFSEQMKSISAVLSTAVGASAGQSFFVAQVPWPCALRGLAVAAASVSGAPICSLDIKRFTAACVTTISNVGTSLAVVAHGLSAPYQMMSIAAASSTLVQLQAGDVLVLNQNFSGGNVAVGGAAVTACVQALQDIKQFFNITQ